MLYENVRILKEEGGLVKTLGYVGLKLNRTTGPKHKDKDLLLALEAIND
jgi:hypothetical protein